MSSYSQWGGYDLIIEPCGEDEPVCTTLATEGGNCTYFYETLVTKLRLRFPLTELQKDVLRQFNVAPYATSPNGWTFIQAFEILCGALVVVLTLNKFFSISWHTLRRNPLGCHSEELIDAL
ncbi:hypothetical protein Fmac_020822 [Flemingia macrophylla]|uniref:Uncharacterized protein n=1 Tax=Flemingia macrophylla TaxID=520843 RepID=A0ABD1LWV9_9FABA